MRLLKAAEPGKILAHNGGLPCAPFLASRILEARSQSQIAERALSLACQRSSLLILSADLSATRTAIKGPPHLLAWVG